MTEYGPPYFNVRCSTYSALARDKSSADRERSFVTHPPQCSCITEMSRSELLGELFGDELIRVHDGGDLSFEEAYGNNECSDRRSMRRDQLFSGIVGASSVQAALKEIPEQRKQVEAISRNLSRVHGAESRDHHGISPRKSCSPNRFDLFSSCPDSSTAMIMYVQLSAGLPMPLEFAHMVVVEESSSSLYS